MFVQVEFTETALGRFMRAVELYIVLVYMLTTSFHHLRHLSFFPVYRPATRSNTMKHISIEKPSDAAVDEKAPDTKEATLAEVIEEQYRNSQEVTRTVERSSVRSAKVMNAKQHKSMAARLSNWMGYVGRRGRIVANNLMCPLNLERSA